MANLFENTETLNEIKEITENTSASEATDAQKELWQANLEIAKNEGNAEAVKYYESKLGIGAEQTAETKTADKFTVDDGLNENNDTKLGSSCESFCQSTRTNSSKGNYTSGGL